MISPQAVANFLRCLSRATFGYEYNAAELQLGDCEPKQNCPTSWLGTNAYVYSTEHHPNGGEYALFANNLPFYGSIHVSRQ